MAKQAPAEQTDTSGGLFPIRTVANLTGVNPVTLRAWERRYNIIRPQRTAKGHRLYSQTDIDRVQRVIALLNQGISIGQVAPMLDQATSPQLAGPTTADSDVWERYTDGMLDAIERFDEPALDAIYNDALSLYPIDLVNSRLTTPLLRALGKRWKEQQTGVAEEHFFSVYLRNKLGTRIHHLNQHNTGPQLLLACLPGEFHEVGMLFFTLAAASLGYRTLVLGANMPLEQLAPVIERRPCAGIVLSGSGRISRNVLDEQLPDLVQAVDIPVFVGGAAAERSGEEIETTGAINLGLDTKTAISRIGEALASR